MDRLKELRKEKGLLQRELAQALGVKPCVIGHWETGYRGQEIKKSVKRAFILSRLFGVPVSELFKEEKKEADKIGQDSSGGSRPENES